MDVIGRDFDDLGRMLARRESRRSVFRSSLRAGTQPLTRPLDGIRMDALSRALAAPMSRRRAIGVITSTIVAGGALRPRFAQAVGYDCPASDPKKCVAPGGAQVCVPNRWGCCSNDRCAGACKPWELCVNAGSPLAGCDDTPLLCVAEDADTYDKHRSLFCSTHLTDRGTYCSDQAPRTLKWGWCCKQGEVCGSKLGDCTCAGEDCDELCCTKGFVCQRNTFSPNACVKGCDDKRPQCAGFECCGPNKVCGSSGCECNGNLVRCGFDCCDPKKTTPDPKTSEHFWDGWFNTLGRTAATHGGASGSALRGAAHKTQVTAGTATALGAMAAVSGLRATALGGFTDGHHDRSFKRTVTPATPSPPKLQAGPGLDASSAAALNALLAADVSASALIAAAATALGRSRAAMAKHDRAHARRQLLASARLSDQAAKTLSSIPALRASAVTALRAGGTAEVTITADDVTALQTSMRRSGLPPGLRTQMGRLGVKGADFARARKQMLNLPVSPASIAGALLIAPLADDKRTKLLATLPSELTRYAKQARSHPIARGHA